MSKDHTGTLRPAEINIGGKLVDQKGNGSFNQQTFADKLGTAVKHGDLDDCVICMEPPALPMKLHCGHIFCDVCTVQQFKIKPVCPTFGLIQGVVTGDQPPGTMKVKTSVHSLPGHQHSGRIEIEYVIHPGKQTGNGSFNQQTIADKMGTAVKHGDLDDCVICMEPPTLPRKLHCGHVFCDACIVQQFKVKPVCPTCGSIQGIVTGDQPPGTMKVRTSVLSLPGHDHCGRIEIEYVIHSGNQTAKHPNEGQWYKGITRIAYLPDNEKGKKIAKLLRVAFDRKLIFTIGHSRTTGEQGVVTWNDIHHKTTPNPGKQFGYPDDTYFDRVLDELRIKGVTEKDLQKEPYWNL